MKLHGWTVTLLVLAICWLQVSTRYLRDPFRLSAFRSCLRASDVSVASTLYEYDPDPENAYGTINGQWELRLENPQANLLAIAFFFPRSPTHMQAGVRCAERLSLRVERKLRRDLPDFTIIAKKPVPVRDLKILHQSESGLVFEQYNAAEGAGLRERCISHNHKPDSVDTCVDPARPERILVPYIRMLFGALYLRELASVKRVLMIGLAGGSFPTSFHKLKPDTAMDIVELDAGMPDLASQWFHFNPGPETNVHVEDGAEFISRQPDGIYDLVIVDAYDENSEVPEAISSKEFGKDLLRVLKPDGGVAALNLFKGSGKKLRDFVRSRFGSVHLLRDGHSTVLLAVTGDEASAKTSTEEIRTRALNLTKEFETINIDAKWLLKKFDIQLD